MRPLRSFSLLLFIGLSPSSLFGQGAPTSSDRPVVTAARVVGTIRVDGVLDEAAWTNARPATEFFQVDPEEGQPGSEATEARILFDDEAIYVGVRLHAVSYTHLTLPTN